MSELDTNEVGPVECPQRKPIEEQVQTTWIGTMGVENGEETLDLENLQELIPEEIKYSKGIPSMRGKKDEHRVREQQGMTSQMTDNTEVAQGNEPDADEKDREKEETPTNTNKRKEIEKEPNIHGKADKDMEEEAPTEKKARTAD